jgi:tetratricopeptide (TPR) repeat protein
MNQPLDPKETVDVPSSEPTDSLDAGLATGFGRKAANGDLVDATARLDASRAGAELNAATKKCLSLEEIDRPKDAQEETDGVLANSNEVQEGVQAAERDQAVAVVREAEQRKKRKKRKVRLALAATVALLLLGGGAFGWRHNERKKARAAVHHYNLGIVQHENGQVDDAIASYRKAIELDPKLTEAYNNLGTILADKGQVDEAIACFRKAIELEPKLTAAHNNLGRMLADKGQVEEAIASYHKAIELEPKFATAHYNLGTMLADMGQVDEAIASYRKAIQLDPKLGAAHNNLGCALRCKGQVDEAVACFRKAIELNPKNAAVHVSLGNALHGKGQVDEAVASYRKAIELDPKLAAAHYDLGIALHGKGQVDEAIANYRKAIELDPKFARAHCGLGLALEQQGRFADSLAAYKRGHELGTKQPDWRYPSAEWVRQAESKAAMEAKLPAFLKGDFHPGDNQERLGLAGLCKFRKLHHSAAGLFAAAFAADPKLADDLGAGHRYAAACHSALAASGQGEDAAELDDAAKAKLRGRSLGWLRADLDLRTRQLGSGKPDDRAEVQQKLVHWQKDSDLAGIRDTSALAKLPTEEQKAFTKLWTDVAALLKKAEEKVK